MPPKPITLNKEQIENVRRLAPYLTQAQLADFLGIAERTFANILERQPAVHAAYKAARADIIGQIAESLVQDALDGDTTSRIFFLKTQAGWRETNVTEHTGKDGGPIQSEDVTHGAASFASRMARLAAVAHPDGGTGNTDGSGES